jgi:hypothetical protein
MAEFYDDRCGTRLRNARRTPKNCRDEKQEGAAHEIRRLKVEGAGRAMVADGRVVSSLPLCLFLHAPCLLPILHHRSHESQNALCSLGIFTREAPAAAAEAWTSC